MSKGKQIGIIVLLVLIIGSFVIVPMLNKSEIDDYTDEKFATFTFVENLAVSYGQKVPLSFEVIHEDVVSCEIYINDSLLKTWKNPKGKITLLLDASYFGLGAKTINLISTSKSGQQKEDLRLIRILSDVSPEGKKAEIVSVFEHNPTSFTQGLEFSDDMLYESTGLNGQSKIAQVDVKSGKILKEIGLDGNYFGEGITILNDKIYQLTWQNQKCFVYDKNSLQLLKDFSYIGEGWGMCNDGKSLIMSNGTEILTFRNPETFQVERTIEVYDQVGPRIRLNELEFINGKIYANIWMLDLILEIDPNTGKVLAEIDCSGVVSAGKGNGEVLNGIAHNKKTDKLYLTGKNWSKLIEVKIK
jgi:glutaminyl-peptide cyclotransferase